MNLLIRKADYMPLIKKGILVFLLIHICLWFTLEEIVFSSSEEPLSLAVVISVEGTVKVRRKSKNFLIEEKMELYEGDLLTTERRSHVRLLYLDEELIQIPEAEKLKITLAGFSPPEQGTFAKLKYVLQAAYTGMKVSLFPQPVLSSPGAARKWLRIFEEAEIIDLLMPIATKVMTRYPQFRWLPLKGERTYEIVIFDGLNQVLWRHQTTKTELTYPEEAPALSPGEYYFWQVRDVDRSSDADPRKDLYLTFGIAYFTLMHEEEIGEITQKVEEAKRLSEANQDEMLLLLLGIFYEKKQLYSEAQEKYEKLVRLRPTNDIYKNMLANLYMKIGRKWAAVNLLQE